MSKKLASKAVEILYGDVFGGRPPAGFNLKNPGSFDFFNSLRLIEVDVFSGYTVSLIRSVYWIRSGDVVSCFEDEYGNKCYSGDYVGPLPEGVSVYSDNFWLSVSSHQLKSQDRQFENALSAKGCELESREGTKESFFMFLLAHRHISFDMSAKSLVENELSWQPSDPNYQGTSIEDFYPYYDQIDIFHVREDSPIAGRSVFWYSYLVASKLSGVMGKYISSSSLDLLEKMYDGGLWHFPIDNARTAISAAHFKHTFVDLYRCLEWLYALPRSLRVKKELGLEVKGTVLAKTFSESLSWRRAERDSLKLLLLDAKPDNLNTKMIDLCLLDKAAPMPIKGQRISAGQPDTIEKWCDYIAETLSSRIYAIRNQFVHQLDALEQQSLSRESESAFVHILVELCYILYSKYADEF